MCSGSVARPVFEERKASVTLAAAQVAVAVVEREQLKDRWSSPQMLSALVRACSQSARRKGEDTVDQQLVDLSAGQAG
jgi:hypothetical protein